MSDVFEGQRRMAGLELAEPPDRIACATSTEPVREAAAEPVPSAPEPPPVKRGPEFTDMFEVAMSGHHLADLMSITSADGTPMPTQQSRPGLGRQRTPFAAGA